MLTPDRTGDLLIIEPPNRWRLDLTILITGWLITNPPSPTEDAVLSAVDANGDVFTANGMRVPFETEYGGANIEIRVDPTVTVTLSGNGAAASIYYERLKWVVDSQP